MQINPGGTLALTDIVGRDVFVAQLSQRLEAQSLILVAERRIGKTHVLTKLKGLENLKRIVIYRDLESLETVEEFVQAVFKDLTSHRKIGDKLLELIEKATRYVLKTDISIDGNSIKLPEIPVKHWKQLLQSGVAEAIKALGDVQIVMLWDELPLMLQKIAGTTGLAGARAGNPQLAMEILDVLRELRQHHTTHLRMVYTGSIGLHHVLRELKARGYANAPTNDMLKVEVPPLTLKDAAALALRLITSNNILVSDEQTKEALSAHIAAEVDGFAFYVHHVLAALQRGDQQAASIEVVNHILKNATAQDDHNTWELAWYRDRSQTYYGTDQPLCLALLDAIAAAEHGVKVPLLIQAIGASYPQISRDKWLELVELLAQDFYVQRDPETKKLQFKFKLVLSWWRAHRYIDVRQGWGD